ncbi:DUF4267 domain-containing protein [Glycomyces tenuis]|uniref:DUF4267 domain-containing protein n=1 Tax=Glycomyces tenuis TaxID=58116 RepID=UPI0003FFD93A|nr:DUF4267 domain-containing protein [Glycomyces tenuis]
MITIIANVLAGLIGAGIIFIGIRGLLAPQGAAGFGIPDTPTEDPTFQAWLSVKAFRDIASGLLIFIVMAGGSTQLLGWFMLAAALIPFGDALTVLRSKGPRWAAYGVHGATAAVMVVISALLLIA